MKKIVYPALVFLLIASNVGTYLYFKNQNKYLRSQSSFQVFADKVNLPDGTEDLSACLKKLGIEFKADNGSVLVREVDAATAVSSCS